MFGEKISGLCQETSLYPRSSATITIMFGRSPSMLAKLTWMEEQTSNRNAEKYISGCKLLVWWDYTSFNRLYPVLLSSQFIRITSLKLQLYYFYLLFLSQPQNRLMHFLQILLIDGRYEVMRRHEHFFLQALSPKPNSKGLGLTLKCIRPT